MNLSYIIGLRQLRSKKRSTVSTITFIALTGVALGVAALLSVLSITSGFQDEFQNKVLGVNAHVLVMKYGLDFSEYDQVIDRTKKFREVAGAAPFVINEMMLAKGDRLSGILVKGIDPKRTPHVLDLPRQIQQGSMKGLRLEGAKPPAEPEVGFDSPLDDMLEELETSLSKKQSQATKIGRPKTKLADAVEQSVPTPTEVEQTLNAMGHDGIRLPTDEEEQTAFNETETENASTGNRIPSIIVGKTLAQTLDVHVGDTVKVISPLAGLDLAAWSTHGSAPQSQDFRVIAIFEAGFQEYDSRLVYVDLYEAQRFMDRGDTVTGVEIRLHDMNKASRLARKLDRQLSGPFHTMDWAELNHNLFTALEIQKIMLTLVIATIIFVAAFNVVATLIMVVLEKKRDIAILKAMGAKDRTILQIFMVQGTVIGAFGTAIGLLIGGGVCAYLASDHFPLDPKVYLIDHLPVRISPMEFIVTILVALAICMTASIIPSWWAARLPPAEGVRYE